MTGLGAFAGPHPRGLARLVTGRRLAALWLGAVLLVSFAVRGQLALSGGQMFWADEADYSGIAGTLIDRGFTAAVSRLDGPAQYFVFKILWTIPDALSYADGTTDPVLLFFGLVSLLHIVLVYAIARRLGGGDLEAAAAATLTAAAATMFYYGRHLLPYDCAMAIGLLAVWVGVRPGGRVRAAAVGALAGLTVLVYPGYWTLGGAAIAIHLTQPRLTWRVRWHKAWPSVACLAATLIGAQVLHAAATGGDLRQQIAGYASAVDQGTLSEGWSLPWAYLWHAEHGLVLLWAAALVSSAWRARHEPLLSRRGDVVGLVVIYGALVVFSVGLGMFVVYGRLARQLVPFLSLVAAHELVTVLPRRRVVAVALVLLAATGVVVQAAFNFRTPLRQAFPSTFQNASQPLVQGVDPKRVRWINMGRLYPSPENTPLPAAYRQLAAAPHPMAYLPYQYEGWKPEERAVLRRSDLRMRLLVVGPDGD